MSRLTILTKDKAQVTMESLYQDLERRIVASPPGLCTIDLTRSFIKMCLAQSCGKCVPCRVGLRQLARLFDDVLDGNATDETLDVIRLTAEGIYLSADCAIGYEAAKLVLKCIDGIKGEIVLVVSGNLDDNDFSDLSLKEHVELYLDDGLSEKEAIKRVAFERKIQKSIVYKEYHLNK